MILIFLFLAAAMFRLFFMDLIEFKFDEAYNIYQLTNFFSQPTLNFHSGLSSSGMHNFPLFHYLLILISLFSRDPQYISFIIALINTTLIPIFYLIAKKYYSNFIAFFSALLLASSPWATLYSRKIWHPDLILLFIIPIFYLVHKIILEKNSRYQWLLFTLLILLCQQHFSGFFFLLATVLILIINKVKLNFKQVVIGVAMGLIPALPYISYNLTSAPFCADCVAYINFQTDPRSFDLKVLVRPLQMINGSYFENVLGKDFELFKQTFPLISILKNLFIFEFVFPVIGLIIVYKKKKKYLFIPVYFAVVLGLSIFTKTPARMYYFVILLPMVVILCALTFDYLWNLSRKIVPRLLVIGGVTFFIAFNFIFEYYFYLFLTTRQDIHGDYGPVYTITHQRIQKELAQYSSLPYFYQLQSYAYLFAQTPSFHERLGEFFIQNREVNFAISEFKKSLEDNTDNIPVRANLTYLYIATGNFSEANTQLQILSSKDSSIAAQLDELLKQAQTGQQN